MAEDIRIERNITLINDVNEVPRLSEVIEEVCEAAGFDIATTMKINLAVEEAVVNVIEYAYPKGVGEVNTKLMVVGDCLEIEITDSGIPFDPTLKGDVDTTLKAEERPIGGLGIYLVRQIMDTINYQYKDGKNVLKLTKKITSTLTTETI